MRTSPSVGLAVLVLSVLATGGTCVEDAVASEAAAHGGARLPAIVTASSCQPILAAPRSTYYEPQRRVSSVRTPPL